MTAIIRTLTEQGYVLAADGRSTGDLDGSVLSDSVQKNFHVETANGNAAYCLAGIATLLSADRSRILIELPNEIWRSAECLRTRKTGSLSGYAHRLVWPVYQKVKQAYESGELLYPFPPQPSSPAERGQTVLRVYLHEFRRGFPCSVSVRLFHLDGKLAEPEIAAEPLHPFHMAAIPVPRLGRIILEGEDESLLAAYRQPDIDMAKCTLQQAIERSRILIEAHSDPEAIAMDERCLFVGGHTHIAVLERSGDFRWVAAPM